MTTCILKFVHCELRCLYRRAFRAKNQQHTIRHSLAAQHCCICCFRYSRCYVQHIIKVFLYQFLQFFDSLARKEFCRVPTKVTCGQQTDIFFRCSHQAINHTVLSANHLRNTWQSIADCQLTRHPPIGQITVHNQYTALFACQHSRQIPRKIADVLIAGWCRQHNPFCTVCLLGEH